MISAARAPSTFNVPHRFVLSGVYELPFGKGRKWMNRGGVVNGIFGTALAQAAVATAGFMIAGVPGALALGAATFLLSLVPVGPPLVWGGATLWLMGQGQLGWGVFMLLWGLFGISSIDNIVKPYLISRSAALPASSASRSAEMRGRSGVANSTEWERDRAPSPAGGGVSLPSAGISRAHTSAAASSSLRG